MGEQGATIWEKLGAAEGLWAVLLLSLQFWLMRVAQADPTAAAEGVFAAALVEERALWEWVTFLRIVAGLMIVWFMGSVAARMRLAEGAPGRLGVIAFGIGAVWGAVWLLSAMFNSASILLATQYDNAQGARVAGVLAIETVLILTPAILVALTFSVGLVGIRYGGFPRAYTWGTLALSGALLVLAVADWYGTGRLSAAVMTLALAWTAVTSALLMQAYRVADPVRGARSEVASAR